MFTLQKVIALIAVLSAVWGAYKFLGKMQQATSAKSKLKTAKFKKPTKPVKENDKPAERTIECQKCGTYFVAGSRPTCDDRQCPFPMKVRSSES
jgi:hypothetical protein